MTSTLQDLFQHSFNRLNAKNVHNFINLNDEMGHIAHFDVQNWRGSINLSQCQDYSIYEVLESIVTLGISIDPKKKLAFLTIEFDHNQQPILKINIGYRGEIALATQFNVITSATANLVFDNDIFKSHGPTKEVEHTITSLSSTQRGECTGGYCRSVMSNGELLNSFLSIEELDEIARCQIENLQGNTPWNTIWRDEMRKVALYRRAAKEWRLRLFSKPELVRPLLYTDAA